MAPTGIPCKCVRAAVADLTGTPDGLGNVDPWTEPGTLLSMMNDIGLRESSSSSALAKYSPRRLSTRVWIHSLVYTYIYLRLHITCIPRTHHFICCIVTPTPRILSSCAQCSPCRPRRVNSYSLRSYDTLRDTLHTFRPLRSSYSASSVDACWGCCSVKP